MRDARAGASGSGGEALALEIEPRVVEFSQGALEKRPRAEVYARGGAVLRAIAREGNLFFRPPGFSPDGVRGESQLDTEVRFSEFVDELLDSDADADTDADAAPAEERVVAVFSHGIAIRCFVRGLFGAEANFVVSSLTANTSITELRYRPRPLDNMGGWQLVRMNDAAHLHDLDAA